jgi:hypothetical protein
MLESIEGAIKNGQPRETGNIDEDNKAKSQHPCPFLLKCLYQDSKMCSSVYVR